MTHERISCYLAVAVILTMIVTGGILTYVAGISKADATHAVAQAHAREMTTISLFKESNRLVRKVQLADGKQCYLRGNDGIWCNS